jgi:hypothetical protein
MNLGGEIGIEMDFGRGPCQIRLRLTTPPAFEPASVAIEHVTHPADGDITASLTQDERDDICANWQDFLPGVSS